MSGKGDLSKSILVRMSPGLYTYLAIQAKAEHRTLGGFVRLALEGYIPYKPQGFSERGLPGKPKKGAKS